MAKVFLSAGHGGNDPGAVANGLREKDINLQVLLACNEVLVAHGVQTVCSRTNDANDPVSEEVREANASGADVAVSFHVNAGGGDGFEAYYYASDANGKKLAGLGEKYVKQLGQNSRGLKSGNHLMFVNSTKMTAVLFESFFVDSNDRYIGDTAAEQRAFGVAYAKAILEYLGIAYKGGETERYVVHSFAKNRKIYDNVKKSYIKNTWCEIDGKYYYAGDDGLLLKEWQDNVDGRSRVYFIAPNWHLHAGWLSFGSTRYYMRNNGDMATGWQTIGKEKYYFGKDGIMRTGWQTIDGKKYWFDKATGKMLKGLITFGDTWYYMSHVDGHLMQTDSEGKLR